MATKSQPTSAMGLGRMALLIGGGVAIIVGGTLLALNAGTRRVETFGLSGLVEGGRGDADRPLTPLEQARRSFNDQYDVTPEPRNPEAAGTKLMLRAVAELNARERDIKIGDVVRHLRDNPELIEKIYALVDTYLARNPQLAENGSLVKRSVAEQLAVKPKRRLDFLEH